MLYRRAGRAVKASDSTQAAGRPMPQHAMVEWVTRAKEVTKAKLVTGPGLGGY